MTIDITIKHPYYLRRLLKIVCNTCTCTVVSWHVNLVFQTTEIIRNSSAVFAMHASFPRKRRRCPECTEMNPWTSTGVSYAHIYAVSAMIALHRIPIWKAIINTIYDLNDLLCANYYSDQLNKNDNINGKNLLQAFPVVVHINGYVGNFAKIT